MIFIKIGETCHGAFFKQRLKYDIIFLDTFDGTKRIELNKSGNI
jgi:hypothetical protein